jgi:AMMECR1 domain-containing protein
VYEGVPPEGLPDERDIDWPVSIVAETGVTEPPVRAEFTVRVGRVRVVVNPHPSVRVMTMLPKVPVEAVEHESGSELAEPHPGRPV